MMLHNDKDFNDEDVLDGDDSLDLDDTGVGDFLNRLEDPEDTEAEGWYENLERMVDEELADIDEEEAAAVIAREVFEDYIPPYEDDEDGYADGEFPEEEERS